MKPNFTFEFDLSKVSLQKLKETHTRIIKKRDECLKQIDIQIHSKRYHKELDIERQNYDLYLNFISDAISIKTIEEMNKLYFGDIITLKHKLPQAEVIPFVEYYEFI
jgi:hypothetical protein